MPPSSRFRRLAAIALCSGLAAGACAKRDSAGAPPAVADTHSAREATKPSANGERDARKIIRTGQLDLVIASYDETRGKLEVLIKQAGGYIDSTQVTHQRGEVSSAHITLRIPAAALDAVIPELRKLGEITTENTNAADVTEEYVDVAARLSSAKTLEKRLLELAAGRAGTVEELLAVERELARVRGEIESFEAKIRVWNDQIAMSTLTLGLSTRAPAIAAVEQGLGQRISSGFRASVDALRDLGSQLAVTVIAILPWLVLGIPGLMLGRRLWRRRAASLPVAHTVPAAPEPPAP